MVAFEKAWQNFYVASRLDFAQIVMFEWNQTLHNDFLTVSRQFENLWFATQSIAILPLKRLSANL